MAKERVLIVVKTYPTLSKKYAELVCTAGFREDGSWIRIYPSPFRFLGNEQQYKKYQWVEIDLEKNPKDPRPESYRPRDIDNIKLLEYLPTNGDWELRRKIVLGEKTIFRNLAVIIDKAKKNEISIATFQPSNITKVSSEKVDDDWELSKKQTAEEHLAQGSLLGETSHSNLKLMPKLPYRFRYHFEDNTGKESKLMIEDWEIGQLYWNCLKSSTPELAVEKVKQKYFDDFALKKDLYLFLGTTRRWHLSGKNPYVVIGTFHPPRRTQLPLF